MIFPFFKKNVFFGFLGPPFCGISATIRIGREMLCLPYAGFFKEQLLWNLNSTKVDELSSSSSNIRVPALQFREHFKNEHSMFSKHRPSGPLLSISQNVRLCVCPCVCSLLRYRLNVFLPPLPEVGCPIFLEIRNPLGKVVERSGLRFEHFCLKIV